MISKGFCDYVVMFRDWICEVVETITTIQSTKHFSYFSLSMK